MLRLARLTALLVLAHLGCASQALVPALLPLCLGAL